MVDHQYNDCPCGHDDDSCDDDCEVCSGRLTIEEIERAQREFLKEPGWYAHVVMKAPDSPTGFNYHTHGFSLTVNHPDIQIVLPLPGDICHSIAAEIYDHIKKGDKFEPGKQYDCVLSAYRVMFIEVIEGNREVLRVIFPDKEGNLLARDIMEVSPNFALQWTP